MIRKRALPFFLFFFSLAPLLWALDVPERPEGYVSDYAGMLTPQVRSQLENLLSQYEGQTTNQVLLVTFPSLEEESLEDFSIRLAEAWKPGQADRDNGVIFLIFQEERRMRIEVGYGLEGTLPDATAGLILQNVVTPAFRAGNFEEGIVRGLVTILKAAQGEFQAAGLPRRDAAGGLYDWKIRGDILFGVIFLIALVFFVIDFFRYRGYRRDRRIYLERYTFWEWWFRFGLLLFVLKMLFEVLFWTLLFSRGGYYGPRGGFGGGGFRGGGGGFGGGGASGGW